MTGYDDDNSACWGERVSNSLACALLMYGTSSRGYTLLGFANLAFLAAYAASLLSPLDDDDTTITIRGVLVLLSTAWFLVMLLGGDDSGNDEAASSYHHQDQITTPSSVEKESSSVPTNNLLFKLGETTTDDGTSESILHDVEWDMRNQKKKF